MVWQPNKQQPTVQRSSPDDRQPGYIFHPYFDTRALLP